MSFRKRVIGWILVPLLLGGATFGWLGGSRGLFLRVPDSRDPLLFGQWEGTWLREPCRYRLFTDGTGDLRGVRQVDFEWGTRDGVLVVKYLSVDAWVVIEQSYAAMDQGASIAFDEGQVASIFGGTLVRPSQPVPKLKPDPRPEDPLETDTP